jgi:L-rhamnose mutarotase
MERIAFYHEVQDGKRAEYREVHEDVPDDLEELYLEAGVERFSLFEADGYVFGYLEVEDPDVLKTVMAESPEQERWKETTLDLLEPLPDDIWMDEIYRLR